MTKMLMTKYVLSIIYFNALIFLFCLIFLVIIFHIFESFFYEMFFFGSINSIGGLFCQIEESTALGGGYKSFKGSVGHLSSHNVHCMVETRKSILKNFLQNTFVFQIWLIFRGHSETK